MISLIVAKQRCLPGGRIRIHGPGPGEDIHLWIRSSTWSRWISWIYHSRITTSKSEWPVIPVDIGPIRGYPWSMIAVDILDPPPDNIYRVIQGDPWSVIPMDILDPRFWGYPRVDPRWSEIPVDRGWSVNFCDGWPIFTKNDTYTKLNQFNYLHLILILSHGVIPLL